MSLEDNKIPKTASSRDGRKRKGAEHPCPIFDALILGTVIPGPRNAFYLSCRPPGSEAWILFAVIHGDEGDVATLRDSVQKSVPKHLHAALCGEIRVQAESELAPSEVILKRAEWVSVVAKARVVQEAKGLSGHETGGDVIRFFYYTLSECHALLLNERKGGPLPQLSKLDRRRIVTEAMAGTLPIPHDQPLGADGLPPPPVGEAAEDNSRESTDSADSAHAGRETGKGRRKGGRPLKWSKLVMLRTSSENRDKTDEEIVAMHSQRYTRTEGRATVAKLQEVMKNHNRREQERESKT